MNPGQKYFCYRDAQLQASVQIPTKGYFKSLALYLTLGFILLPHTIPNSVDI